MPLRSPRLAGLAILAFVAAAIAGPALARGRAIEGGPDALGETRSLGEVIASASGRVHITVVHGMRADGPGESAALRAGLARRLRGREASPAERRYLDVGERPRPGTVAGVEAWRGEREWQASRPFVDRYPIALSNGSELIVDEVNWWPLLFPLKCRVLVLPEHDLSGADRAHLRLCARSDPPYHPWLSAEEVRDALERRPRSGGGPLANRRLKQEIMNWGLADAVVALGPMRRYISAALNAAFAMAEEGAAGAGERVIVSASLGSFAVLDSAREGGAAKAYLARTDNLYFLANQFALLELARVDVRPGSGDEAPFAPAPAAPPLSPVEMLRQWAAMPPAAAGEKALEGSLRPRQVIAFSDPGDLLTYRVPALQGAKVVNLYVRNAAAPLGLFEDPVKAHAGHLGNRAVWDILLGGK
ncbi:MAG: hypothetical protein JOZ90_01975 [Alphaproteobacteria bacterium]|nr:hypothetical protein [Alphaproteobacteria bacterium]MBV9370772.1 hypothetical protein [Alphaproteobacteria bacterium]MBV9899845.1 hypothetical protein [Alphaproteobacteria bacterium]